MKENEKEMLFSLSLSQVGLFNVNKVSQVGYQREQSQNMKYCKEDYALILLYLSI